MPSESDENEPIEKGNTNYGAALPSIAEQDDKEKDEPSSVFWKRPAMVAVSKWALSLRWWWTMLLNWGCFLEGITFAIPEIHKHDKRITFVQFLQYFAEWLLTRWQLSDLRTTFVLGLSDHVSWSTDSDCRKVIVKCNK